MDNIIDKLRDVAPINNLQERLNGKPNTEAVVISENKAPLKFEHVTCATQMLKFITVADLPPIIKKVMSMKLSAPLLTGVARSNLSIALELGCREEEVCFIEQEGVKLVEELLRVYTSPEMVEKFNKDRAVEEAVKNMGKSVLQNPKGVIV
jgi:hypothetical protein